MKKFLFVSLVMVLALSMFAPMASRQAAAASDFRGQGLSVTRIDPEAAAALKSQGRAVKVPFPNAVNHGKKFNPSGEQVLPVSTDALQNVLVLFIDFQDTPPGADAARLDLSVYDQMLFGQSYDRPEYQAYKAATGTDYPTDRTLYNYYKNASYGQITVTTKNSPSTLGWAKAPGLYSDYVKGDNGFGVYPYNVQGLVVEAVKQADSYVNFNDYAVMDDGQKVIPNLFVVFAGTGAEWSGTPDLIWSHSWSVSSDTPAELANGYLTDDGVYVDNYAMMPEVGGDLTGYLGIGKIGPFPPTVGVFAHEYGHVLGLPDQYDYGYESEGTGIFSLMAGGSWNRFPNKNLFSGNSPADLDAWSKVYLGFVKPVEITNSADVVLPAAELSPVIYKMVVPFSGGKEYYLFENRQPVAFDQGFTRFGSPHGLAIYHVDETVLSRTFWRPNEAENWKEIRSTGSQMAVNGEYHYAISILQADGRWDMEHGYNYGDSADLYNPTTATSFGSKTSPNNTSYYFWAGSSPRFMYSGVAMSGLKEENGVISAKLFFTTKK